MTDFLTRLAERSLRVALVLEPLKPPMFAPESPLAAGVPQESMVEEGTRESAEPGSSPRFRPVLAVRKGDEEGVLDRARTIVPSQPSLVAPPTTLPEEPPPRPFDMQPEVPRRELPQVVEPPAAFSTAMSPRTLRLSSALVREEGKQPAPSAVMMSSAPPHAMDQQHGPGRSVSHVSPIPETHADTLTPEQQPTQVTPDAPPSALGPRVVLERVLTPSIASVEFPADQRRTVPEPSPTAPTIRVSIGRIEVRAIMPSVSPARPTVPARPRPQLSLEDYLQQHRGKSR